MGRTVNGAKSRDTVNKHFQAKQVKLFKAAIRIFTKFVGQKWTINLYSWVVQLYMTGRKCYCHPQISRQPDSSGMAKRIATKFGFGPSFPPQTGHSPLPQLDTDTDIYCDSCGLKAE